MNPFHLFTFRGIPVFVNPMYFFLLLMIGGYRDPVQLLISAVAITISLLVHEFGHALVARRLKHDPTIMLHGFGGLTSRSRTGRDVEEAAIVAMGPAAGLALGLLVFGALHLLARVGLLNAFTARVGQSFLFPCIVWNLLNLLPLWPLDGGQLIRLGTGRLLKPDTAAKLTHGLSLLCVAGLVLILYLNHSLSIFPVVILGMLGMQNVQALQGRGEGAAVSSQRRASPLALDLVKEAGEAFARGEDKEAARLAHQARAQDGVTPAAMDRIWEILGVATERLGDDEEALAYLKRAKPNERVRAATERALSRLDRSDELDEYQKRWGNIVRAPSMSGWLTGALTFIALAVAFIFNSSLSSLFY